MSLSQTEKARRVRIAGNELSAAVFLRDVWKDQIQSGEPKKLSVYRATMRMYAMRYRRALASL